MRVIVCEPEIQNHYLALNSAVKIYNRNPEVLVEIVTTHEIAELLSQLKTPLEREIIPFEKKVLHKNLRRLVEEKKPDRVHLISISENNLNDYIQLGNITQLYIGIHKFNYCFPGSTFHVYLESFKWLAGLNFNQDFFYITRKLFPKRLKQHLKIKWFFQQILKNQRHKFIGYGPTVHGLIREKFGPSRAVHIPFSIYEPFSKITSHEKNERVIIGIPGRVHEGRRNYISVFSSIQKHLSNQKELFTILLIGRTTPDSREHKAIKEIQQSGFSIEYFTEDLRENQFLEQLIRCDFILGNLNTKNGLYDKYCETGVLFNMIRAAKPGLLPSTLTIYDELHSSVVTFDNNSDLCQKLNSLMNDKTLRDNYAREAAENSLNFTPDKFIF